MTDRDLLTARIGQMAESLAQDADAARAWVKHLGEALAQADADLVNRVRDIVSDHRRRKQDLSDELWKLSQELGHLPPPRQAQIAQRAPQAAIDDWDAPYPPEISYRGQGGGE